MHSMIRRAQNSDIIAEWGWGGAQFPSEGGTIDLNYCI